jgi:putative multiple sugar transport system substrate-binding protein
MTSRHAEVAGRPGSQGGYRNKKEVEMRKFTKAAVVLAAAGALALTGCGGGRTDATSAASGAAGFAKDAVIGVALPQKTSENWVLAESLFNDGLKNAGFTPSVQFANGGVTEQQNQIQAMITKGAKVLIVGAIDGSQLGTQLAAAKQAGITVIAYDRLLTNTADDDYYVAFDNYKVGQLQGEALLQGLAERKGDKTKWNIELLAGSPDDSNAKVFFDGAMSVLQPKIDDGTLTVLSKQTKFEQVVTQGWKAENAQKRMDAVLSGFYQKADLDGILSPNDTLARAAMASVDAANKSLPVVTGQDSEVESVKSIMAGQQYSTIYKDTNKLVAQSIVMVQALQAGKTPEVNDTKSYNNGVKVVPAYLLTPVIVTKTNAAEVYASDKTLGPLTK